MRMSQGKGEVQKRGSPEDMLHLPHRARNDLATTFHRASKQKVTCATGDTPGEHRASKLTWDMRDSDMNSIIYRLLRQTKLSAYDEDDGLEEHVDRTGRHASRSGRS